MSDSNGDLQNQELRNHDLPSELSIVDGTNVDALWEPFRFYEAGHFKQTIMNPLSSAGLDQIIAALDIRPGERVLDIACGHGDFLLRASAPAEIIATGVDLSPWTIRRAFRRLSDNAKDQEISQLLLGDGRRYLESTNTADTWDIIALIGAPWIWGGFEPSAVTLAERLRPGGRLVIADVVATSPEARERLPEDYGAPLTDDEQRAVLTNTGLEHLQRITTSAADWRRYDDDVLAGLHAWVDMFPDDQAFVDRGLADEAARADPVDVSWQVWIARKPA